MLASLNVSKGRKFLGLTFPNRLLANILNGAVLWLTWSWKGRIKKRGRWEQTQAGRPADSHLEMGLMDSVNRCNNGSLALLRARWVLQLASNSLLPVVATLVLGASQQKGICKVVLRTSPDSRL